MNFKFTFKQMESSNSLMNLAIEKVGPKIALLGGPCINPHFTFSCNKTIQKVHFSMLTSDGYPIEVSHSGKNLYFELDEVAERIEMQLRRHKEKRLMNRKGALGLRGINRKQSGIPAQKVSGSDITTLEPSISAEEILEYEAARRSAPWNRR